MITWILSAILIVWVLLKRFSKNGKIKGQPLGMPRGTVRALITIIIVSFPLNFLIMGMGNEIPSLIINSIFVLVAFYFTARRSSHEKIKRIIKKIKDPEMYEKLEKEEIKPLYLPRFTVRSILVAMLILILIVNFLGPNVPFETTDTLVDLLAMIFLFIVGTFFRKILMIREKKEIKNQVKSIENYESLSINEILDKLIEQQKSTTSWLTLQGKNILSLLILIAVFVSLICYTIEWDYTILMFSFRDSLLLLVNGYYGFRD